MNLRSLDGMHFLKDKRVRFSDYSKFYKHLSQNLQTATQSKDLLTTYADFYFNDLSLACLSLSILPITSQQHPTESLSFEQISDFKFKADVTYQLNDLSFKEGFFVISSLAILKKFRGNLCFSNSNKTTSSQTRKSPPRSDLFFKNLELCKELYS